MIFTVIENAGPVGLKEVGLGSYQTLEAAQQAAAESAQCFVDASDACQYTVRDLNWHHEYTRYDASVWLGIRQPEISYTIFETELL